MIYRKLMALIGLAMTVGLCDSAVATTYNVIGVPTVTYVSASFHGVPAGTYDITGSIDITLSQDLGTTAEFNVNAYVLSLDADHNGVFFEASDVIVETTPFVHIGAILPNFGGFPGPVTLTTDAVGGTWDLQGRIGEYDGPGLWGGNTGIRSLASGTFSGSFLNPAVLLMTASFNGGQQLGPFLNPGGPPLTFGSDCNNNGIHDECDLDCGTPGGPCDVPGCGQSNDCNANGVPDECDIPDCNANGIPDDCEALPARLFVDAAAIGAGDGTNWTDALVNLQDALCLAVTAAGGVTEIWVANGTYLPDQGTNQTPGDRTESFQLVDGVSIYGGLAGTEDPATFDPATDPRDFVTNETILSGDLAGIDSPIPPCASCIAGPIVNPSNGHIYYLLPNAIWSDSETQAVALGGQLATINDAVENQWILDRFGAIGGVNRSLWIGLTDQAQEGVFAWVSGQAVNYTNWRAGEPNNAGAGENWAQIQPPADTCGPGQWNDLGNTLTYAGCSGVWPNHGVVEIESFTDNSFHVVTGSGTNNTAILDGFTITGGNANVIDPDFSLRTGGGMFNDSGSPKVENCVFTANTAVTGAGMSNLNNSNPIVAGCLFEQNHDAAPPANGGAAAMRNEASSPQVANCNFVNNATQADGGAVINEAGSAPVFSGCRFVGNQALLTGSGGAMSNNNASPTLVDCAFIDNETEDNGGAMNNIPGSSPTLTGCTFIGNSAAGHGGAMFNVGTTLVLTGCKFIKNAAAQDCGGVFLNGSGGEVIGCSFVSNTSSGNGAAIRVVGGGTLHASDCLFIDNSTGTHGGAIAYNAPNLVDLINCRFYGNTALGEGGAIKLREGPNSNPKLIANCHFSGNSALLTGGAIEVGFNPPAIDLQVASCTFADNSAGGVGGSIHFDAATLTIDNTIFWDETAQSEDIYMNSGNMFIQYSDISIVNGPGSSLGSNNITTDPLFVGGPGGTWTADALHCTNIEIACTSGSATYAIGQSLLIDINAKGGQLFTPGELAGKLLQTDTTSPLQTLIVDNTNTTITVWGDFTAQGTMGAQYQINDYRLAPGSPAIDAADNTALGLAGITTDLDENPRFRDDPDTPDTGNGTPPIVDMGAYEFQFADCNNNGIPDAADIDCGGLIISEIMDGTLANGTPKYVEITNAGSEDFVFLEGGLIIQSNLSTALTIGVDLTGVTIPAGESFVIVSSAQDGDSQFVAVFGFAADLVTPFGFGNGNDRYMITTTADSSIIVDSYGEDGVDGFGTPWEYTDSFAFRLPAFKTGVGLSFDAAQWSIAAPNTLDGVGAAGILAAGTPGTHDSGPPCVSTDCNNNGIPDECDIDAGSAAPGGPFFCTMNCAPDFNNNGVPDRCDFIGDFDGDGVITPADVQGFVDSLLSGGSTPLGDFNGDGTFDGLDIDDFVQCLLGGPCP